MPYDAIQVVHKIECKNHLLRNFRSWLMALGNDTKFPLPPETPPDEKQGMRRQIVAMRKVIKNNVIRLSNAIDKASANRAAENG